MSFAVGRDLRTIGGLSLLEARDELAATNDTNRLASFDAIEDFAPALSRFGDR